MAPQIAKNAPTAQHHKMSEAEPRSPAIKPVVVKIPVPTMLETTNAVALKKPNLRRRGAAFDDVSVLAGIRTLESMIASAGV